MFKAVHEAFQKVSSSWRYRGKHIADDDYVRIIRHEYEVPDDLSLTKSHLNMAMGKGGRCSTGNLCSVNGSGVYRNQYRPLNSSTVMCYFVTEPGNVPPDDVNWQRSIKNVDIGQERHANITKKEKEDFAKLLPNTKGTSTKEKPNPSTGPSRDSGNALTKSAGDKREVSPEKDGDDCPKRPRIANERKIEGDNEKMAVDYHGIAENTLDGMITTVRELISTKKDPCVKLQTLAHLVLRACGEEDNGLVSVKYLDRSSNPRVYTKRYIELAEVYKSNANQLFENRALPRSIKLKVAPLNNAINLYAGHKDAILQQLAKKNGYVMVKEKSCTLTADEVVAFREYVGSTGNHSPSTMLLCSKNCIPEVFPVRDADII